MNKVYIIQMSDQETSVSRADACEESVKEFMVDPDITRFEATQPEDNNQHIKEVFGKNIPWTWATDHFTEGLDLKTGLYKRMYQAKDQRRVVSCGLSHFRLWKESVKTQNSITILEHDAKLVRPFDPKDLEGFYWGAVGLNDPRGNTRKGTRFHNIVEQYGEGIHRVPVIDEPTDAPLPMGLAGNSAYIITPDFAKRLLAEMETIGMWPNDAIMCRQLFPRDLKVAYPYYTTVQSGVSTTTGI